MAQWWCKWAIGLAVGMLVALPIGLAETHWEIQAVDENGLGTHPKVGADPTDPNNRVVVEGIALNSPDELVDTRYSWMLVVQGEGDDHAGTQAWAGSFYQPWPDVYPTDIQPGDRVRITGFIANFLGKININERHSPAPQMNFQVEVLERGVGMPEPELIPSIADCNFFDQTRLSGGEWYQSRWVRLNDVWIAAGQWAPDHQLTITDSTGETLGLMLSSQGDFAGYPEPRGPFDVIGIFDQEPWPLKPFPPPPYTDYYRIWVKRFEHILVHGDLDRDGDVDLTDFALFQTCFTGPAEAATLPAHGRHGGSAGRHRHRMVDEPLYPPRCETGDMDHDGDIDMLDFQQFVMCFTGPLTAEGNEQGP